MFKAWFGGPDNFIWKESRDEIVENVRLIWAVYKEGYHDLPMECEYDCDANVGAYIAWYDNSVHLCQNWWKQSRGLRAAIILHELSHEIADTDDHFYYPVQTSPMEPIGYETDILRENADTYEGLYLKYNMGLK